MATSDDDSMAENQSVYQLHAEHVEKALLRLEQEDMGKPEYEKTVMRHQQEALMAIKAHYANANAQKHSMVVLPTGTGKSLIAVLAPYMVKAQKVLMIAPSKAISKQLKFTISGNSSLGLRSLFSRLVKNRDNEDAAGQIKAQKEERNLRPVATVMSNSALEENETSHVIIANAQKFKRDGRAREPLDESDPKHTILNLQYFPGKASTWSSSTRRIITRPRPGGTLSRASPMPVASS